MRRLQLGLLVGGALAVAVPTFLSTSGALFAADHLDPPARTDPAVDSTPDKAADIADIYTFHDDTNFVIIMTFAGPQAADLPATYDRNVLYTLNVSNNADKITPTFPIHFQFGTAANGAVGVKFYNLPGVPGGVIQGPVDTNLVKGGVTVRAGLFDDPFFFDLEGFKETRSTGTLHFDKNRNFFAGQNDTAVVIQIPIAAVQNGNPLTIWGNTARFGGQL